MLKKFVGIIFLLGSFLVGSSALYTMDNNTVAVRSSKRLREKQDNNNSSKRFKSNSGLLRLQPTMQDISRNNIYVLVETRENSIEKKPQCSPFSSSLDRLGEMVNQLPAEMMKQPSLHNSRNSSI